MIVGSCAPDVDYHRVQRKRAKKVSDLLARADLLARLTIASVMLQPVEQVMQEAYQLIVRG